ncbi:multi-sensor hybrid histidine kinase [Desulfotomaculum nigrificans CO-1-SRB]|uniref:Circadian input-output histidine kinase CikA n=1 Tax=Desulfotomaculum nigrificans (strain DSM 14880 / VKM B-2319 / CO-1-SRB) TaxID=868595 RepID=F6B6K7_DESCC|nr:response regulator [Desulfotomaculum nigrificans]AEF94381.1 multi-sensor hybrid histidine kinase [Desulfotomaculum nigrificans CO-1-SRB]
MKDKLIDLLKSNEENIITRLIDYAKVGGFTRYNSTRHEDWQISVREIIRELAHYVDEFTDDVISVHDNAKDNSVAKFGIKTARTHRARGITLRMFLGLFKYYRQAYLDIIDACDLTTNEKYQAKKIMNTYFDRYELAFCSEWAGEGPESRLTEMQAVNRALTNEKNKLRTIFESMNECVFVVDSNMRITEINAAAAAYFGVAPEEVLGMHCASLLGCNCDLGKCHLYHAMKSGSCYKDIEIVINTKRGPRRILTSGSFLHDISGKYAGGVQVFVDVTERYNMEQALRLHKQANNSSSECVTIFNENAQLIYANQAAIKLFNRSMAELMGLGIEEVYPGGDKILFNLIKGDFWQGELTPVKDNPNIYVHVHANPIRENKGKIIGFYVAARDITEHKMAQLRLREARQEIEREAAKLRAIVSILNASIALADANDRIIEVNEKCLKITGKSRQELIGRSIWDLHQGETLDRVRQIVDTYKQDPNHPPINITRRLEESDVIMSIQPVYRDKIYDGILLMVVDVTEVAAAKRQAEEAREAAERANQAKSEFLANMSHEIRTPMNGILGFAEILLQTNLNSQQEESVRIIQQCGENLLDLINDILDLSKIESGKMVLEQTTFSLRKLIYEAVNVIEPKLIEKGVEIKISIQKDLPDYFKGDPTRIRQVLNNLLSNAAKFTHEGHVEVKVNGQKDHSVETDSFTLVFSVSDTGIGIPREKLDLIFESFTQADGSTTRKYGGTGLGLTISRSLINLMGGQITVESEVNRGSKFSFSIPGLPVVLVENNYSEENDKENIGSGVVLVAEDEWTTKQLIANYLEKAGYTVVATDQGKQVLTLAKIYQPDVLVLDILLPDLSGWEVLAKIKKDQETQDIPVVVCSVLPEKERAFSLGAVDFIEKPVSEKVLVNRLQKLTHSRRSDQTHIVLIDDDKMALEFLNCIVGGAGYQTHSFMLAEEALNYIINGGQVHAIILDLLMPGMDGFEFLDNLRADANYKSIPVLIYTGKDLTKEDYQKLNDKYERLLNKSFMHPDILLKELSLLIKDRSISGSDAPDNKNKITNVLLVEDNQFNQRLIQHLLADNGYRVTLAENGQQALEMLNQSNFDIVLMDMQMPVMDGYETTRVIRSDERYKSLPIIALTAHAMKGDNEKCLAAGCDDYLAKPVKRDILIKTIKKYIQPGQRVKKSRIRDTGVESLVPWYLQDLAGEMDKLKHAANTNDFTTVRYISHGLKGSGGAYGFPELSDMGAQIERAAINQEAELVKSLVVQLRELYTQILEDELQ